ncbi:serine/arginine repetitive matrix protein 1-like [Xiphophorus hellerii]|uniref:serine/arginine repetitive matrix protein 1-like n=1 Tax=Xiphophorus hellerii TaxID=8084 RepID=UPI0013B3E6F4|nr:serine/arginine repetitive matrix protein 1-like [Xiphophorus hellerii]
MAWDPYPRDEEDWTTVHYHRGRQRTWQPADRQRYRPPQQQQQQQYRGRSYASAVRTRPTSRSRSYRPPRYRPQPYRQPRPRSRSWHRSSAQQQQQRQRYAPRVQSRDEHRRSDDPLFTVKVRALHKLLKATHHLQNVSRNDRDPPAIQRITANLASVIKPAHPSPKTLELIDGNAREWSWNTILILRQHYEEVRAAEKQLLQDLGGDLLAPLEVAVKWAKRNLGSRFNPETADEVQIYLLKREKRAASPCPSSSSSSSSASSTSPPAPRPPPPPSSCSSASCPGRRDQAVDTEEDLDGPLPPPSATPPPSPPPRPVMTTTATMTEPTHGGWTPPGSTEEDNETATPLPPPTEDATPLPQRQDRAHSRNTAPAPQGTLPPPPLCPSPPKRAAPPKRTERELTSVADLLKEEVKKYRGAASAPLLFQASDLAQQERRASLRPRTVPLHLRLQVSTQRRLTFDPRVETSAPAASSSTGESPALRPAQVTAAARQVGTLNKNRNWSLDLTKKYVILGDSNVARFPASDNPDLQVVSFPGARWRHLTHLFARAPVMNQVERMILSLGINHRAQRDKRAAVREMKTALRTARIKCPNAEIFVPAINFSLALPVQEQMTLTHINIEIAQLSRFIPALPRRSFTVSRDNIHWTKSTAAHIFSHWGVSL